MAFIRLIAFFLLLAATPAMAQPDAPAAQLGPRAAPTRHVEVGRLPTMDTTPSFDPAQATARYLAHVNGAARNRSNAYFEGGYWLKLVDLIYTLGVAALLLWSHVSLRIREVGGRAHPQPQWPGDTLCRLLCALCHAGNAATDALRRIFPRTRLWAVQPGFLAMAGRFRHRLCREPCRGADFSAPALCRHSPYP